MIHPFEINKYEQVHHFHPQYNTGIYVYNVGNAPTLVRVLQG